MFAIKHFDFVTKTLRTELQSSNELFEFCTNSDFDPYTEFVFVEAAIDRKDYALLAEYNDALSNGLNILGVDYKPMCATASGSKMAVSVWVRADARKFYSSFCRFGFVINGMYMAPCKFYTRMGLMLSTSVPYEKIYGKDILCKDIEIIPDVYRNGHNASDGGVIIFIDKKSDVKEGASSLRPIKGLAIHVVRDEFLSVVGDQEITDKWNNTFKLSEKDALACVSAFKWFDLCDSREAYEKANGNRHLRVAVYMNKHSWKHMTYQPAQTLDFDAKAISELEEIGKAYINGFTKVENALKLVPPETREAVSIYPQLLKDSYLSDALKVGYRKQKMILRGGAIPNAGKFMPIAPDIVDMFNPGAGLKAGECCCHGLPEGEIVMLRYPHTSAASFVRLINRHIVNGVADDNIICINNYDDSLRRLGGADYDGDKVLVILDEKVKSIVCRTLDAMGELTMPDALEGKAQKYLFTKDTCESIMRKFFMSITQRSNIGSVSNKLTAALAMKHEATTDDEVNRANTLINYWQTMVEVTVDKEKHGDTFIARPEELDGFNETMPEYVMFAKLAKKIGTCEALAVDKTAYRQRIACPLEQYSVYINENTKKASEFEPDVDGEFFYENLMFNVTMPKMNNKAFHAGEPMRDENGQIVRDANDKPTKYVNHGIFDRIVFANTEEVLKMAKEHGIETGSVVEMRKQLIDKFMDAYASKYECDKRGVYNRIVFYVYTMENQNIANAYKRVFWSALHEYAEAALIEKRGQAALDFDLEGVDECDTDEDQDLDC